MVQMVQTKHTRLFGNERYLRVTDILPWRRARVFAKELRDSGAYRARVDSYQGGSAVFAKKIPESKQVKIRTSGKSRIATVVNEELAIKYITSEVKKGRGVSVGQRGKGYKIRTFPMERIPKPKIVVKRMKKVSKAALLRKLKREEIVVVAHVNGKAKVRRTIYSNSTYTVEAWGRITAQADYDEEGNVQDFYLIGGASVGDLSTTWEVNTIAQGIKQLRAEIDGALSSAGYINERWKYHHEEIDMMDFEESVDYNFYDLSWQGLKDEGWS